MELIRRPTLGQQRDCVVTIGSFDGIHLGHRALIERLLWHAQQLALPAMLLSFEPLPREFLQPDQPPARLTNLRERFRLLQDCGIERFRVLHFNQALRVSSGLQFMQLLALAGARVVVVGHDFRFGRGGEASAAWCASHAAQFGFTVDVVAAVELDGVRVSSGKVRAALERADFSAAQRQLGRAYAMRGRVRGGDRLGRTLGFPTANIAIKRRRAPLQGVFAVRVSGVPGAAGPLPGVANLGTRPMVGGGPMLLEVHLFDFEGELYGCELSVEFVSRLRDERTFESMGAMVLQMQRDAAQARALLGVAAR
jgi:riboflavin kinase / FMN adenylyltransferase